MIKEHHNQRGWKKIDTSECIITKVSERFSNHSKIQNSIYSILFQQLKNSSQNVCIFLAKLQFSLKVLNTSGARFNIPVAPCLHSHVDIEVRIALRMVLHVTKYFLLLSTNLMTVVIYKKKTHTWLDRYWSE